MIYENDIFFLQRLYDRFWNELTPTHDEFTFENHSWYLNEEKMTKRGKEKSVATIEIKSLLDGLYFAIEADTDHANSIQDYAYNNGTEKVDRNSKGRFEFLANLFLTKFKNKIKWTGQESQKRKDNFISDFVDDFMLLPRKEKGELSTKKFMITDRYDNQLYIYYPKSEFEDLDD